MPRLAWCSSNRDSPSCACERADGWAGSGRSACPADADGTFLSTWQLKQDIDDPLSGLGCLREALALPDWDAALCRS